MKLEHRFDLFLMWAVSVLVTVSAAVGASDRRLHVCVVEDEGSDPVEVTVPLGLAELALGVVPEGILEPSVEAAVVIGFPGGAVGVRADVDDTGFTLGVLRELWQEVRRSPDGTFVTVESGEETVEAAKSGKLLVVKAAEVGEDGSRTDVEIPLEVLDAFFSGHEGRVSLAAAVRALGENGGSAITVRDDETVVRIWVD